MGLLSSSVSITRYKVEGKIEESGEEPIMDFVLNGLRKNAISEVEDESSDMLIGWTSLENPYQPNFDGSSFTIASYFVFSLRLDKKSIPSKMVQKHCSIEMAKRLAESGRDFLSRNEKKEIRNHVVDTLTLRIPFTPNVYDLIWDYEESSLWFFSTQKQANEELETLFLKSFKLTLIRLFPFTIAQYNSDLSDKEKDVLDKLSPTNFRSN